MRSSGMSESPQQIQRTRVLGRKNHYGSRRERGTLVAALFYSLIESTRLAGVNPHDYLRLAVEAALDDNAPPLPHEIKESGDVPSSGCLSFWRRGAWATGYGRTRRSISCSSGGSVGMVSGFVPLVFS